MAIDIRELDHDDPEFEAKMEAALREEYEADGLAPPGGEAAAAESGGDDAQGAKAEAGETPAAGAEPADTGADAGEAKTEAGEKADDAESGLTPATAKLDILSKDGKQILPNAVLQSARAEAKRYRKAKQAAEEEAAELREKLAKLEKGGATEDMRERAEAGLLTDEERHDWPALAKIEAALQKLAAEKPAKAEAQKPAAETTERTEQEMLDERRDAIDSVPLLALWEATDPVRWAVAVKHDAVLEDSPKWSKRPLAERFAEAARRAAAEFEDDKPQAAAQTPPGSKQQAPAARRQDHEKAAHDAPRITPSTLSDFKGGGDSGGRQNLSYWDMTDEEIEADLRRHSG